MGLVQLSCGWTCSRRWCSFTARELNCRGARRRSRLRIPPALHGGTCKHTKSVQDVVAPCERLRQAAELRLVDGVSMSASSRRAPGTCPSWCHCSAVCSTTTSDGIGLLRASVEALLPRCLLLPAPWMRSPPPQQRVPDVEACLLYIGSSPAAKIRMRP